MDEQKELVKVPKAYWRREKMKKGNRASIGQRLRRERERQEKIDKQEATRPFKVRKIKQSLPPAEIKRLREERAKVREANQAAIAAMRAEQRKKGGTLDDLSDALLAAVKSAPEAHGMYVRMFANLPMPETFLLCRLLLSLDREWAVSFVKGMARVANVQTNENSWR